MRLDETRRNLNKNVNGSAIQRPPNIILHHDPLLNEKKKKERKSPKYTRNKKNVQSDVAFPFSFRKVTLNEIINEIKNLKQQLNLMTFNQSYKRKLRDFCCFYY